jgi:hypothetical protein
VSLESEIEVEASDAGVDSAELEVG